MSRTSTRTVASDSSNGTCQKAVESWSKLARLAGNSGSLLVDMGYYYLGMLQLID